jgi:hypothetical protein
MNELISKDDIKVFQEDLKLTWENGKLLFYSLLKTKKNFTKGIKNHLNDLISKIINFYKIILTTLHPEKSSVQIRMSPTHSNLERILKNSFNSISFKRDENETKNIEKFKDFIEVFEWVLSLLLELSNSVVSISELKNEIKELKKDIDEKNKIIFDLNKIINKEESLNELKKIKKEQEKEKKFIDEERKKNILKIAIIKKNNDELFKDNKIDKEESNKSFKEELQKEEEEEEEEEKEENIYKKELDYILSLNILFPLKDDSKKLIFSYNRIDDEDIKKEFGNMIYNLKNDLNIYAFKNGDEYNFLLK